MTTATLTEERLAEAVGNLIDQFKGCLLYTSDAADDLLQV